MPDPKNTNSKVKNKKIKGFAINTSDNSRQFHNANRGLGINDNQNVNGDKIRLAKNTIVYL